MGYNGDMIPKRDRIRIVNWPPKTDEPKTVVPKFTGWQIDAAQLPMISVMVRHDEAAYIEEQGRCLLCGHLEALHELTILQDESMRTCKVPDDTCPCRVR